MKVKTDGKEVIREYYGKILSGSGDLKTGACCSSDESWPAHLRDILEDIDDEIISRFYGCGSPIPPLLDGCTVLDIGCGTGRDVYIVSRLVGPEGRVIGVDMTGEQLEVARKHVNSQTDILGYEKPNVEFKLGYIEDLAAIGIDDGSVDVVISNCVINLSPDKESVFREIFRVLKPGGELYFSDIFSGRRVSHELTSDPVLRGECLAGAMYIEDFRRILLSIGCPDFRIVTNRPVEITDPRISYQIGMVDFTSRTIRAFKLHDLEDICEDYGQTATYLGTIPEYPHSFPLDDHHLFTTGKAMLVCGNTASMLLTDRYTSHFKITGDRQTHFGPFECAPAPTKELSSEGKGGACC